jgi:hypothetical protein
MMKKLLLIVVGVMALAFVALSFFKFPAPSVEVRQGVPITAH